MVVAQIKGSFSLVTVPAITITEVSRLENAGLSISAMAAVPVISVRVFCTKVKPVSLTGFPVVRGTSPSFLDVFRHINSI